MFGDTGLAGAYQSVGIGVTTDAIYLPGGVSGGATQRPEADGSLGSPWCVQPQLGSLLVDQPVGQLRRRSLQWQRADGTSAKGAYCNAFTAATGGLATKTANYSCNPDFNIAQVGMVTRWTPVKNLTFSAEVGAFFLDQKFTGGSALPAPATPKPVALYEFKDQSTVFVNVRVQRNF